ncbi:MAG TPA: MSMEG_4193 family putative phosphomutase [Acidimicrobiales bacterium]|nr:MSMEG_4193 family putative phosphomutase [Acidimicrobiales bacterium]
MPTTSAAKTGPRAAKKAVPSTLVLLIRHGTTPTTGKVLPGRAPGLHLAEAGQQQAATVAERLRAWSTAGSDGGKQPNGKPRITAVYASPLERTRETASPIAKALGLRVQTNRGLLECDFGDWTGAELKDLVKRPEWATVQRYPSGFRFPGGETFTGMQARIVDTVADLCRRHPGEAIVAVSHADPIKAAVADALGSHLDLFQRIVISPCSVTAISYGALGPVVLAVNSTSALTDLVPS